MTKSMTKSMTKEDLYLYSVLIAGSILFPVGVTYFIAPYHFNSGGLTGIAQILSWLAVGDMHLSGAFLIMLNVPLFILAWKKLHKKFIFKTTISLIIQSTLLSFLEVPTEPIMGDPLASVVVGSVICGIGCGLCLQSMGCAGGLDILGVYFASTRPDFKVGKLSYIVNFFVEMAATMMFGLSNALYSLIFILAYYFVSDKVHLQNICTYALIITSNPEVKNRLLNEIHRGVTEWSAKGAYTGNDKELLLCIMNRYEVRQVKKIVHETDPKAFMLLTAGKMVQGNFESRLVD